MQTETTHKKKQKNEKRCENASNARLTQWTYHCEGANLGMMLVLPSRMQVTVCMYIHVQTYQLQPR
jgi:hypothetical protein